MTQGVVRTSLAVKLISILLLAAERSGDATHCVLSIFSSDPLSSRPRDAFDGPSHLQSIDLQAEVTRPAT